ncbi:restriction endonuclease subunit S [uncultured Treponema sp.]|uniref:restriction endonuclease subunit S n=1 Tax=uncultured Treponema sp. TaxID=162155 RepID=UPI0025847204|nr:restriction endonuclease subunit S [uncultured Treponema sp.]
MDTKQLKAKILDLAIHGKLLPLETLSELKNSPDYEPASKLLEKLRAEKEEKIAKGELKRDKKDSYIFVGDDNRHYEKFADGSVKDIEDEIPFEVPEGWGIVHPNQIGTFQGGKTPSEDKIVKTGNIPYFKVSDMNVPGNELYMIIVSNYLKDNCSYRLFPKDSIVYPKNGGAVFTNKKRILIKPSLIDLNSGAFIPSESINNLYAYYLFLSIDFNQFYKGTAVPTVDHDLINELYWEIPPLTEQKRIVSELERIFSLIDSLETDKSALQLAVKQAKAKILDLAIHGKLVPQAPADEPASALLEKLRAEKEAKIAKGELKRDKNDSFIYKSTTDNCHYEKFSGKDAVCIEDEIPFELPEGWAWCRLGEISSKLKRGKSPKYTEKSSIMAFAQKCNQKDGPTTLEKALYIDESTLRKYPEEEKMQFNDIVINSTGTGTLGRVGIFDCNIPDDIAAVYPDSHVSSVRINSELFAKYFYYFVKSKQSYLETMGEGSTNQKELKIDTIANLIVSLPPISEQKRIVSKIEELFETLDQIQSNLV